MLYHTLISPGDLANHLGDPDWAIIDCRFVLDDPQWGRREYRQGHIPGAIYAHLDEDLSGELQPGRTGRHPLPPVEKLQETFSRWGIGPGVQVVAYDDASGALAAARLWWLLQWAGHQAAAVLDGGWRTWLREGGPVRSGEERRPPRNFTPRWQADLAASSQQVQEALGDSHVLILDARAHDRYLGQNETIDPVAGHIPGALSVPYAGNLDPDGKFLPAEKLRARYAQILKDTPAERVIIYCGSGVTAAHNVLAVAVAGLGMPRLYAGSWSEWITDPTRPVEGKDRLA